MPSIPARITGLMSAGEMAALRTEAAATAAADQFTATVDAYSNREVRYDRRLSQDQTALHYLLGGLDEYVRRGGDRAVVAVVARALEFAASH